MGMDVKTIVGIFLLLGFIQVLLSQSCNRNCTACSGGTCLNCDDGYTQSQDGSGCCSKGCNLDANSYHACNINTGECSYTGCLSGYFGPTCEPCPLRVRNCDICALVFGNESIVHCTQCAPSFFVTTDKRNCCPEFCDSCEGPNGQTCTSCKSEYYLYNDRCDSCGDYCLPPADNTARCDALTGTCLYGCLNNWHGSKCDVECTVRRCDVCTYDEPTTNLTCGDCIDGFQGPYCLPCYDRCLPSPVSGSDPNICFQDGTCRYGCDNGYRGDKCDRLCEEANGLQNCAVCDRYQFSCTECKDGYWGDTCQFECRDTCVRRSDRPTCSISQGSCDFGCIGGYYLHDCTGECPNCGRDTCNRTTGECLSAVCDPGFYGVSCNLNCPTNCAPDPLNGMQFCDFSTGGCTYGCIDGKFGTYCTQGCSVNCASSPSGLETGPLCSQTDGACDYQCRAGYYRNNCTSSCKSQCVDNTCDLTQGTCLECAKDEPGFLCPFGTCPSGTHGVFCDLDCPINCHDRCDRNSSVCGSCTSGYYGDICDFNCGACSEIACSQDNGICFSDCADGYYSLECNQFCLYDECQSCDRTSGECVECRPGLWSANCGELCSDACLPSSDGNRYCNKETGVCEIGACQPGYYTSDCLAICNQHCRVDANGHNNCDFITGVCRDGCQDGFFGQFCNETCNLNCVGGVCERDGACYRDLGCVEQYYGFDCSLVCLSTCTDNACHRDHGDCDECRKAPELQSPLCRTAKCRPNSDGFYLYGLDCDIVCPMNCQSSCDRYTGACDKCIDGFWGGIDCTEGCGNCLVDSCQQNDGSCNSGCISGYYGDMCDQECLYSTCGTCDRVAGYCVTCQPGYWGDNCEYACSGACVPQNDGRIYCDMESSDCLIPQCMPGYYLSNCTVRCNSNCLDLESSNFNNGTCNIESGVCDNGCKPGWYGDQCEQRCSFNCLGNVCDRNGRCSDDLGCLDGYYGFYCSDFCQQTCNDNTCDRDIGLCLECLKPPQEQSPLCRSAACPVPYYGVKCNVSCPIKCYGGACGRYDSVCESCIDDYWGMECRSECGDCLGDKCDQSSGGCAAGCDDGFYGPGCTRQCKYNGCQTCDQANGECTSCKNGLYGTRCDFSCSEYCLRDGNGVISCDRYTGVCDAAQCQPGYFQPNCRESCNDKCGVNMFGYKSCQIDTGYCDVDCQLSWYGPRCSEQCATNCINQNCNRTGACKNGCLTGYWGTMCQAECQPELTCNNGACDQVTGICLECQLPDPSPLCRTAACQPFNTWGQFCENECPVNCADGTCSRDNGVCSKCKDGYHGDFCDQECPNCVGNKCYQIDGACIDGCLDGWYTLTCMSRCLHSGCFRCERNDGQCLSCLTGLFGTNCSRDCSRTCTANTNGQITCNRFSGECDTSLCRAGYYTPQCTAQCSTYCANTVCDIETGTCEPCSLGWYGQKCDGQCSDRCKNKDCIVSKDNCRQGCTDGYWGSRCESFCNSNCDRQSCNKNTAECIYGCTGSLFFGPTCSEPCNGNCVNGMCNRTGFCEAGCKVGWYGEQCKFQCDAISRCTDGSCDRLTGLCNACFDEVPDDRCPTAECPSGRRGTSCNDLCTSENCLYNTCGRYDDKCKGCPNGYYGNLCAKTCPNCKEGTGCEQDSGICLQGCKDGWYTETCTTQCSPVCGSCERSSGECVTCAAGRWGNNCEQICSSNCAATQGISSEQLIFCDKQTGACSKKACKVGFWRQDCTQVCSSNCLPDDNNNRVCAYLDGECSNGCKDTFFGKVCDQLCSVRCRDQLCTGFANSCDISCADGYYGGTCSGTCSTHCAGNGKCDPSTGQCFEGCELGYYGPRCDDPCKNTCVDSTCDSDGGCPDCKLAVVGPNCRVQVCTPGFYGPTCETSCPGQYCYENRCQRNSGICENGCLDNYYGAYCTEICQCDKVGTDECEQSRGTCICKPGRFGTLCDQTCNDGCFALECERDGKCSSGCNAGRYGALCDKTCENCFNQDCGASTGTCLQGCKEGWYGPQCNNRCDEKCRACHFETGACSSCADRYYGFPACEAVCSNNCLQESSGRTCSQTTGECFNGCKSGYFGERCTNSCGRCASGETCDARSGICMACADGWWGDTCKNECNARCATSSGRENGRCRQSDGNCNYGCVPGFYSDDCDLSCESTYCTDSKCDRNSGLCLDDCEKYHWGVNCEHSCSECKNGECDKSSGYCTAGCLPGRYGDRCENTCLSLCRDNTCESSGYCLDCQLSPKGSRCLEIDPTTLKPPVETVVPALSLGEIIGISVGCVVFVIIFVIVFVCCMNYKRRYDDAKTEIHLPSDVLERLSTHRSLHSTVSTNYPVARVVGDEEKDFVLF